MQYCDICKQEIVNLYPYGVDVVTIQRMVSNNICPACYSHIIKKLKQKRITIY